MIIASIRYTFRPKWVNEDVDSLLHQCIQFVVRRKDGGYGGGGRVRSHLSLAMLQQFQ